MIVFSLCVVVSCNDFSFKLTFGDRFLPQIRTALLQALCVGLLSKDVSLQIPPCDKMCVSFMFVCVAQFYKYTCLCFCEFTVGLQPEVWRRL